MIEHNDSKNERERFSPVDVKDTRCKPCKRPFDIRHLGTLELANSLLSVSVLSQNTTEKFREQHY